MRIRKVISMLMIVTVLVTTGCGTTGTEETGNSVSSETEEQVSIQKTEEQANVQKTEEAGVQKTEEKVAVQKTDEQIDGQKTVTEKEDDNLTDVNKAEEQVDIENISSTEFAPLMKMGWNLGNTLDANAVGGLESENCWGQPTTTQELIRFVKSSGFTSIRIPVSWGKHTDSEYSIDPEWMARVKEVVDYAYDEGMFVIINSHHDNDYYYPSEENSDNAKKYISAIWSQIAEEFKNYDNHLVFESMNEPRLAGTDIEWWFNAGDPKGKAAIVKICELNQIFVDTVRASGGNNANRFLMVPSYAASQDFALNSSFVMPEDPSGRVMLSVHAYTPYDFAGKADGYKEWDGSKTTEFIFMGKLMTKFITEGYGVVIGEFGATNKDNQPDRERWARGYTMKAASLGMSYFIWDNGAVGVGEENFGLIDRHNLAVYFPNLLEAYKCGYPEP